MTTLDGMMSVLVEVCICELSVEAKETKKLFLTKKENHLLLVILCLGAVDRDNPTSEDGFEF